MKPQNLIHVRQVLYINKKPVPDVTIKNLGSTGEVEISVLLTWQ